MQIESVEPTGRVVIAFSDDFIVLDDLSVLKSRDVIYKGEKKVTLEISVPPVEGQTQQQVNLQWEPISFTARELTLKLTFDSPSQIGYQLDPNKLVVKVWDCLLYTSPSPRDRTRSRMPSSA